MKLLNNKGWLRIMSALLPLTLFLSIMPIENISAAAEEPFSGAGVTYKFCGFSDPDIKSQDGRSYNTYVCDRPWAYVSDTFTVGFLPVSIMLNPDTLYTTVYESYKVTRYLESMTGVSAEIIEGTQGAADISVSAESPIGNALTYRAVSLPHRVVFNAETRTLVWTPDSGQAGAHHVAIEATDGALSSTLHFEIKVLNKS